jgi:DNA-binding MarR family transcriptional regulator/catechol 2,3-dioxygenase-like lactoylglutathione lyase family enzyme
MVKLLDYLGVDSYGRLMTADVPDVTAGIASDDTPVPTLLRGARGAYAQAIRAELDAIGVDDLPRNGVAALFGALGTEAPPEQGRSLRSHLGVSKQAISQLVETLVQRGYLVRTSDPDDARRVVLAVTEPGQDVIDAVVRAVDSVDEELAAVVSGPELLAFRKALAALARIKTERIRRGASRSRPERRRTRFEPIFPVRDLAAALAHYQDLGFTTESFDEGYGFAERGGVSLHLAARPDHDASVNQTAAYLQVSDADAVHAAWSRPGIGGTTRQVEETLWGMREGSHTDPDGNLIRFGSPLTR